MQQHRVRSQSWRVTTGSTEEAFLWRSFLGVEGDGLLLPLLEEVFDDAVPADRILRLDRLQISLRVASMEQLAEALPVAVRTQLAEQLRHLQENVTTGTVEGAQHRDDYAVLLGYLRRGMLPWDEQHEAPTATTLHLAAIALRYRDQLLQHLWVVAEDSPFWFRLLQLWPVEVFYQLADWLPVAFSAPLRQGLHFLTGELASNSASPSRYATLERTARVLAGRAIGVLAESGAANDGFAPSIPATVAGPFGPAADVSAGKVLAPPPMPEAPESTALVSLPKTSPVGDGQGDVPMTSIKGLSAAGPHASSSPPAPSRNKKIRGLPVKETGEKRNETTADAPADPALFLVDGTASGGPADLSIGGHDTGHHGTLPSQRDGHAAEPVASSFNASAALTKEEAWTGDSDRQREAASIEAALAVATGGADRALSDIPEALPASWTFNPADGGTEGKRGNARLAASGEVDRHLPTGEALNSTQIPCQSAVDDGAINSRQSSDDAGGERRDGRKRPVPHDMIVSPPAGHLGKTNITQLKEEYPATYPLLVQQAGLVLLHPFMQRYLQHCGVLEQTGRSIRPELLARSAALLHFLATGIEEVYEHELGLVKVLVGISPETALPVCEGLLREDDRREADMLLQSAITHWSALKNTSAQGFRGSFLQRHGLLRTDEHGWRLQVERKAFDMLLDQLPWGIGIVKLPWMKKAVTTEW